MTSGTDSVVPPYGEELPVTSKTSSFYDIEGLSVAFSVMGAAIAGSVIPAQPFSANGTLHFLSSAATPGPIGWGRDHG